MDIAYISLIIFIIITIIYCFFGKVPITIGTGVVSEEDYFNILSDVSNQNIMRLGIYFLIVIITQFVINTLYLINKCGGSAGNNIGGAALITFLPWIFIFGAMIVILILFPGFKGAFSNVVGYFAISSSANQILANILDTDTNIEDNMKKEGLSDEKKTDLKKTAELILKLCGNKSLLINQMSPENFLGVWQMMKSLMKENQGDFSKERQDLLNLVVMKDNIGEMMWYIYTGVLLTSIISFNLATRGCIKSAEQLKASHDEYLQQEEEVKKQKELNDSQTVTLT